MGGIILILAFFYLLGIPSPSKENIEKMESKIRVWYFGNGESSCSDYLFLGLAFHAYNDFVYLTEQPL